MNENSNVKKQKKKLNAIDWFLILAVLLCLAGAAFRLMVGSDGGALSTAVTMEDYVVSFKISNIVTWVIFSCIFTFIFYCRGK